MPDTQPQLSAAERLNRLDNSQVDEYGLLELEVFWRDHYGWLKENGYVLRPRYNPEWVASWKGSKKHALLCEDGAMARHPLVLDALRVRDGNIVVLRRADLPSVSDELKIGRLFSSEPLVSNPRNHCAPVYDRLTIPGDPEGNVITVMPYLVNWKRPKFRTFGEVVEFFRQIFEGLQFMHEQHVAHNDVKENNIMMSWSPLYDHPPHPVDDSMRRDWKGKAKSHSRTTRPTKYYFIDYDLSVQYNPEDGPALHVPGYGGDQSVPEFSKQEPCDPFAVDVYCLGNMIRQKFIIGDEIDSPKAGFEFMEDLIADMTQDDPTKRPKMGEVVARFQTILQGMSSWKLRSRVAVKGEGFIGLMFRTPFHWFSQILNIAKRTPPIPTA